MNRPSALQNPKAPTDEPLSGRGLECACGNWLHCGNLAGWSKRMIAGRRYWCDRLLAFLATQGLRFDTAGCRAFFHALKEGDPAAGVTDRPTKRRAQRGAGALSPASLKHVHSLLSAMGAWLVKDGQAESNPIDRVPAEKVGPLDVEPLTVDELRRILDAARATRSNTQVRNLLDIGQYPAYDSVVSCARLPPLVDEQAARRSLRCGSTSRRLAELT